MSKKSQRSLIMFVAMLAVSIWYFSDDRTPAEKAGQISVDPNQ